MLLSTQIKQYCFTILGIIISFLTPIIPLLLIVGMSIFFDTITGVLKAKKKKEKVTSRKLSQIISKMVLYQSAVILFYGIEKYMLSDIIGMFTSVPLLLTKLVSVTLTFIEIKSISENLKAGWNFDLWSRCKGFIARAKEMKGEIDELKKED